MAIIIGTDSNGYVTYTNEPETEKTLFKNIDSIISDIISDIDTIESSFELMSAAITALESEVDVIDITEDITVTPGNYCGAVEVLKATKSGKYVAIKFTVKPDQTIGSSTNINFTMEGITPAIDTVWRFALGSSGTDFIIGWISNYVEDVATLTIKKLSSSNNWTADTVVTMNGIIPLADPVDTNEEDQEAGE